MARMSRSLVGLVLTLTACVAPYEATVTGDTRGVDNPVAICYTPLAASKTELAGHAQNACGSDGKARLVRRELNLDYCTVLAPMRATYACETPPAP